MTASNVGVSLELRVELEQFLYREARLLEENRRHEWLALFADDATYKMPVRETVQSRADRRRTTNQFVIDDPHAFDYIDEDRERLAVRVSRLETGFAHVEQPESVTVRLITNIEVEPTEDPDEFLVRSNFWVSQMRYERTTSSPEDQIGGKRVDILRRDGDGWQIARRTVIIAQPLLPKSIAILL